MSHEYNGPWTGENLTRGGFPLGGMGAGMIALEGSGKLAQVSIRHRPGVNNEPLIFSAIHVRGAEHGTRVLEGPPPDWKRHTGSGFRNRTYGLPLFESTTFDARFPFATVHFEHPGMPLQCRLSAFSPFVPNDADSASLPVASLEYTFTNTTGRTIEAVYSFHSSGFIACYPNSDKDKPKVRMTQEDGGFVIEQPAAKDDPAGHGQFAAWCDAPETTLDSAWFRGGWFDAFTKLTTKISTGDTTPQPPHATGHSGDGSSLYVPFTLEPGASRSIRVLLSWYVPASNQRAGLPPVTESPACDCGPAVCCDSTPTTYCPWYASRFKTGAELRAYWRENYRSLESRSAAFTKAFFSSTLPAEVIEAAAANLCILKSPTVLRQHDGRLWAWEGCHDDSGCCHGTCTHVWNYAQAIPHLFPALERTLRETEFTVSQNDQGRQTFRSTLPIQTPKFDYHAAADGQLGGLIKLYRDWRISGDTDWLRKLFPSACASINYCIRTWDPQETGLLVEPHHNTYDIEFWGPDGLCTSFYLGALKAMSEMARALKESSDRYDTIYARGKEAMEKTLFDGEYFNQQIRWRDLLAKPPHELNPDSYSPEALAILEKEGPKYQYGTGCLSDGVLGAWMARVAGLGDILDVEKTRSHLMSVYRYNFRETLREHVNPQRSGYAELDDAGLLLCSWPKGGRLALPFPYSEEVWTGIEYQVASHLMLMGEVEAGLRIVRAARARYDGVIRSPFNEIECGFWYARAMASYGLLEGLTGIVYDAIDKTLAVKPTIPGDFTSFLSTASGFGTVSVRAGKVSVAVAMGAIDVQKIDYTPFAR